MKLVEGYLRQDNRTQRAIGNYITIEAKAVTTATEELYVLQRHCQEVAQRHGTAENIYQKEWSFVQALD